MLDVLYAEEVTPRSSFEFFRHLRECVRCEKEYLDLVETRELLGQWDPPEVADGQAIVDVAWKRRVPWWPAVRKVAAGFLILLGMIALLQQVGIVPQQNVSKAQLAAVVNEAIRSRHQQDQQAFAEALLEVKEELQAHTQLAIQSVYEDLASLEQRYVQALERVPGR
jgi:hypothetical protein